MNDASADAAGSADPTDPYAREAQTFPQLPQELIDRAAAYGAEEDVPEGTELFARGDRGVDFFILREGRIDIVESDTEAGGKVINTHGARQFTGEMDLFNDREILVSGRSAEHSKVIRIRRPDFRHLMANEPDIAEIIMRAFILRRVGFIRHGQGGVVLIGTSNDADTLRLARFMTRNGYPHRLLDVDADPDARPFLDHAHVAAHHLPVVIAPGGAVMQNPANARLADALGLTEQLDPDQVYDLAVVGAGPAGLAAAVYGASEGLSTIVLEGEAPGGQAGTSSKIENYLGFPTGISGQALAGRAQAQAQKFGARLAVACVVTRLDCERTPYVLTLDNGQTVQARAVVIATGARYRKLAVENYAKYEGQGIHYAATAMEAQLCTDDATAVVGGGNSAGQAAMFLSRHARHVHVLVRGAGLAATMSDYLVQRLATSPLITIHPFTEITGLAGDPYLRDVTWTDRQSGATETVTMGNLFAMIGAAPNTDWLKGCLELDDTGFVRSGFESSPYATSLRGVFAVGDARSGSVKRVASGVGEGSVVVQAVHRFLNP